MSDKRKDMSDKRKDMSDKRKDMSDKRKDMSDNRKHMSDNRKDTSDNRILRKMCETIREVVAGEHIELSIRSFTIDQIKETVMTEKGVGLYTEC
jgi:DNA polymerase sigma